jgi:hypothetical protein
VPPGFDPYGTPGSVTAPLFPQDPLLGAPPGAAPPLTRFYQGVRFEHHWLSSSGGDKLGLNDSEISVTFAFPFFHQETPVLVTPGFRLQVWDGPVATVPVSDPTHSIVSADLPPRTYEAYLDVGWNPQFTPWLGGEFGAQVGVYSDFSKLTQDSIRVPSYGLAVLSFSPSFQIKAGIIYLDRNKVKLLPAGGLVWTPASDTRFEILFPNPRVARRLTTIGTTDWWYYLRGEYGGGSWTIRREFTPDVERIDYNDLRVALGMEFQRTGGLEGFVEVGLAFDREVVYVESPEDNFRPSNTFFLGGGIRY